MARLSREFVKLETRLLNDYRFFTMTEFEQLVFLKLLGISRSTSNQIPKNLGVLADLLRVKKGETGFYLSQIGFSKRDIGVKSVDDLYKTGVKSALKRIKTNFPKFRQNKYFYYFDGYELRLSNSVPKGAINSCVDVDEDLDEDKDEDRDRKKQKFLNFVLLTQKEHQTLCDLFGEAQTKDLVEKLNNYIGSKGKKYKSHYFTILNWAGKDGIRKHKIDKKPEYIKDFKEPNAAEQKKVADLVKSVTDKMGKKH